MLHLGLFTASQHRDEFVGFYYCTVVPRSVQNSHLAVELFISAAQLL